MVEDDLSYRAVKVTPMHEVYQHSTKVNETMYAVTFMLGNSNMEREVFIAAKDELDAMIKFKKRWVFNA